MRLDSSFEKYGIAVLRDKEKVSHLSRNKDKTTFIDLVPLYAGIFFLNLERSRAAHANIDDKSIGRAGIDMDRILQVNLGDGELPALDNLVSDLAGIGILRSD